MRQETSVHGLTGARLAVLTRLDSRASLSLSELATAEGVTVPTMARIVNSLEEGRLVTRSPSNDDRRKVQVVPTTLGRSLARGSRRRRSVWLASYLNRLSDADRATIARATTLLSGAIERPVSRPTARL
ncbi:MAG: MarR family transcriptional regulator [Actinobacteria bacterium]|nr:MarR family transcriptional regulator [Actinomycetota bacterium]